MALAQPLLDVFDPSDRFLKRLFAPFSQQTSSDATNLNAAPFNCTQSVILLNYFLLLVPARGIIQYFILYLQSRFLYFQMVNISEKRKSRITLFQKHMRHFIVNIFWHLGKLVFWRRKKVQTCSRWPCLVLAKLTHYFYYHHHHYLYILSHNHDYHIMNSGKLPTSNSATFFCNYCKRPLTLPPPATSTVQFELWSFPYDDDGLAQHLKYWWQWWRKMWTMETFSRVELHPLVSPNSQNKQEGNPAESNPYMCRQQWPCGNFAPS